MIPPKYPYLVAKCTIAAKLFLKVNLNLFSNFNLDWKKIFRKSFYVCCNSFYLEESSSLTRCRKCVAPQSIRSGINQYWYRDFLIRMFNQIVPCHRVIASDRKIGGFFGEKSGDKIEKKKSLLKDEGVTFDADGKVSEDCLHSFPSGYAVQMQDYTYEVNYNANNHCSFKRNI